jgi:hypothetical protein
MAQKFDKLTRTYGHILSYARQGSYIRIFIFYVEIMLDYVELCLSSEFYCGHFKPIPDE